MAEDLGAPLKRRGGTPRLRRSLPVARSVLFILLVLGAGIGIRLFLVDDPAGGRPAAEVPVTVAEPANPVAEAVRAPVTITADPETPAGGGPQIIVVDEVLGESAGLAPLPDLIEETQYGPIPRVGANGQTPFSAYRRPFEPAVAGAGRPQVAIVMTGMGLNEQGTLDAVDRLPPEVTLAFAPYGRTLDVTVPAAREAGHEVLLQVPLEPFDYPDNDPGPETLLTGQPPRANLDRLYKVMAKTGGYLGLMNHMGARFTASAGDFSPVMEELGMRGLGYLDDGSSNRSVAAQLAETNNVPFARAELALDDNPSREAILAGLQNLVREAEQKGSALGVISALPISISTLAEWAAGLQAGGVVLVPASSLMQ